MYCLILIFLDFYVLYSKSAVQRRTVFVNTVYTVQYCSVRTQYTVNTKTLHQYTDIVIFKRTKQITTITLRITDGGFIVAYFMTFDTI